jgi:preprotein translocase subunit SecG
MITLITILIIISAVLLVLVVLAQNPKGGGANQFAGVSTQLMGVKKTGDLLEKLTWGFAVALIVLSLAANLVLKPATIDEEETETPAVEQPAEGTEEK